jgi:lipid A ethanolaminephosphotransferase
MLRKKQVVNSFDGERHPCCAITFLSQAVQSLEKNLSPTRPQPCCTYQTMAESCGRERFTLHGLPLPSRARCSKARTLDHLVVEYFEKQTGLQRACLKNKSDKPLTHDNYFHSVLGLMGVTTEVLPGADWMCMLTASSEL